LGLKQGFPLISQNYAGAGAVRREVSVERLLGTSCVLRRVAALLEPAIASATVPAALLVVTTRMAAAVVTVARSVMAPVVPARGAVAIMPWAATMLEQSIGNLKTVSGLTTCMEDQKTAIVF
jgi:hypothetical protein